MTAYRELVQRAWPVFREAARMRRTISYSELAGLPPVHGLYATMIPLIVYAILGPSRILVLKHPPVRTGNCTTVPMLPSPTFDRNLQLRSGSRAAPIGQALVPMLYRNGVGGPGRRPLGA